MKSDSCILHPVKEGITCKRAPKHKGTNHNPPGWEIYHRIPKYPGKPGANISPALQVLISMLWWLNCPLSKTTGWWKAWETRPTALCRYNSRRHEPWKEDGAKRRTWAGHRTSQAAKCPGLTLSVVTLSIHPPRPTHTHTQKNSNSKIK